MKIKILALFFVFLLTGCATHIPFSPQDSRAIRTIAINPYVEMPDTMFFHGDGSQYTKGLGIVGAVISDNIVYKDTTAIRNLANQYNIRLERIIIDQVSNQINQSTHFRVNSGRPCDAYLKLKVVGYGFMATKFCFSNSLAPLLGVEGQLWYRNRVVWQDTVEAGIRDTLPSYTMSEILGDPRRLNHLWQAASNLVAKKLACQLNGQ